MTILIGTDPELFVFDTTNDRFVSAHDLIPGSKAMPFLVECGAVQPDGVAAEFNTFPAASADEFVSNVNTVMAQLDAMIKDKNSGYILKAQPTADFDEEYFKSLPVEVRALGCTPDYDAWEMAPNKPPHADGFFRTGAGHIHIGHTLPEKTWEADELSSNITRQLDCSMYFLSLLWDSDSRRRQLYGKIGAFRPKTYGTEYRPLSNAWLKDDQTKRYVYEASYHAVDLFFKGTKLYEDDFLVDYADFIRVGCTLDNPSVETIHDYLWDVHGFPAYAEETLARMVA